MTSVYFFKAVFNVRQGISIWDFYLKNKTLNLNEIKIRNEAFYTGGPEFRLKLVVKLIGTEFKLSIIWNV